jgi:hypothetical protein
MVKRSTTNTNTTHKMEANDKEKKHQHNVQKGSKQQRKERQTQENT